MSFYCDNSKLTPKKNISKYKYVYSKYTRT